MESTLRKGDTKLAELVSDWLDKYFYSETVTDFERVYDKDRQIKGMDVIFNIGDKQYTCDEKCGNTRINSYLQSFLLELSFTNRAGFRQDGWFLNKNCTNNSYLFIWADEADVDVPTNIDEIREVEVALVRKEKIIEYLKEIGLSMDVIRRFSDIILKNPLAAEKARKRDQYGNIMNIYGGKIKYNIKGIDFCYSTHLVEKPINLIIPRDTYRKLSDVNKTIKV